ncbi:hypothetical protein LR48_Vigan11g026200 [Vigna angularis]|uniref:Uncharacterized protein n=1 Tax=Phaseolus angularis TaxID=3914 RepID=A0A0L9VQ89_PHAAN|nr:hypothetical protein LR48_Vigan11g026200 [Vigna angularis]
MQYKQEEEEEFYRRHWSGDPFWHQRLKTRRRENLARRGKGRGTLVRWPAEIVAAIARRAAEEGNSHLDRQRTSAPATPCATTRGGWLGGGLLQRQISERQWEANSP